MRLIFLWKKIELVNGKNRRKKVIKVNRRANNSTNDAMFPISDAIVPGKSFSLKNLIILGKS